MSDQSTFWREQYSHIVNTINAELDRFWVRFNVGLAVNSALIGILAYVFNISPTKTGLFVLLVVSILGIVLSSVWSATVFLSRRIQTFYRNLAVKLEDAHEEDLLGIRIFPCEKPLRMRERLKMFKKLMMREKENEQDNLGTQNVSYVSYVITWSFWAIWLVFAVYSFLKIHGVNI